MMLMVKNIKVHLDTKTYFRSSAAATYPIGPKPAPFDRGGPNAVREAFFRDSSPGSPEIFDSQWLTDPIINGKKLKMEKMI